MNGTIEVENQLSDWNSSRGGAVTWGTTSRADSLSEMFMNQTFVYPWDPSSRSTVSAHRAESDARDDIFISVEDFEAFVQTIQSEPAPSRKLVELLSEHDGS